MSNRYNSYFKENSGFPLFDLRVYNNWEVPEVYPQGNSSKQYSTGIGPIGATPAADTCFFQEENIQLSQNQSFENDLWYFQDQFMEIDKESSKSNQQAIECYFTKAQSTSFVISSTQISPEVMAQSVYNVDLIQTPGEINEYIKIDKISLEKNLFYNGNSNLLTDLDHSCELKNEGLTIDNNSNNDKYAANDWQTQCDNNQGEINNSQNLMDHHSNLNKDFYALKQQQIPSDNFQAIQNQGNDENCFSDIVSSFDYYAFYKENRENLDARKPIKCYKKQQNTYQPISSEERKKRRKEYCDSMRIRNHQRAREMHINKNNSNLRDAAQCEIQESLEEKQHISEKSHLSQPSSTLVLLENIAIQENSNENTSMGFSLSSQEEILSNIQNMQLSNKKNVVKNIMNAFKNFILEAELKNTSQMNSQLVRLYNLGQDQEQQQHHTLQEIIKKFKRYINSKSFNHYSMRLLIVHVNYGAMLRYFLQGPVFEWAKTSKASDLEAHFLMVDFLLISFQDIKHLDQLRRHEKKKAHYQ